jgi:DNA-directed RNA polymerase subunit RPC12/RpoP
MCGPSCSTDSAAENDDARVCRFCGGEMLFYSRKNFSNAAIETTYKCSQCGIEHSTFQGEKR